MYFEDIFNRSIILWKEQYSLKNYKSESVPAIASDFTKIDRYVDHEVEKPFNGWEKVMIFIIYQVLTDFALNMSKHKEFIDIRDIPVMAFEEQWVTNFTILKDEEFNDIYKGFKFSINSETTLDMYLRKHGLKLKTEFQ
jgi:hypothetical protein